MSTDREYLAEGAQSYFDCNDEQNPPNGIHNHINTRTELKSYDPVLYGFLKEIFPCQNRFLKRCDARAGMYDVLFELNHPFYTGLPERSQRLELYTIVLQRFRVTYHGISRESLAVDKLDITWYSTRKYFTTI